MSSPSEIKKGVVIKHNNDLWVVTDFQHINPGKGSAFVRTKMKNVKSGKNLDQTYKVAESIEIVPMEYKTMQYLFHDQSGYTFMDMQSYEQIAMPDAEVGDDAKYLSEGLNVIIAMHDGKPISLQVPRKLKFVVTETEPAVKGDTASGNVTKEAKVDAGFLVQVPIFINQGDTVVINTETGAYVERG